jgi:hypothetical protein
MIRLIRAEVFEEFRARRDAGEEPLATGYRVLHVEQQGRDAIALLCRRTSPVAPPVIYELRLRKDANGWAVAGETVTPWPGVMGGSFLPPRKARSELRDPARLHRGLHSAGEAVGRAGDVRLDPPAVLPAVAGHVTGGLGRYRLCSVNFTGSA